MAKKKLSDSETSSDNSSSDDEIRTPEKSSTDYEKQRQSRIADNKARMESLGLRNMAISLMGSPQNTGHRKRGALMNSEAMKKEEDDEEYDPNLEEEDEDDNGSDFSSSGEEFEKVKVNCRKSRSRSSGKVKSRKPSSHKNISMHRSVDISDFRNEDEALMQAIALSLKDSGETSVAQQAPSRNEKEDSIKKRKRKPFSSRVQMTPDDVMINFCQFDEVGKGSITLRDLQRMAAIHDFTWTDKELADMIWCFDRDKDGKLTLEDFQNIVMRCKMLQEPENT